NDSSTTRDNAINEHLFLTTCATRHADRVDHQDEIFDSDTPIIDKIIDESGEEAFPIIINFRFDLHERRLIFSPGTPVVHVVKVLTTAEFDDLWSMVETPLTARWCKGRGKKPSTHPKHVLFLTLTHYFIGKHKLYTLKLEVSVSPEDRFVDMSSHRPGSVSDLTIFSNRVAQHRDAVLKGQQELTIEDKGEMPHRRMNGLALWTWDTLAPVT
ncbi:hypothetical protein As57867_010621, partial [Aphanomyces stellatus]